MATRKTGKKTTQSKNLYLALTIAFFLALIAIFVFDGYMGVYDTVTITTQERETTIEPERWLQDDYSYYTWVEEGEKVYFHYELDNRRFSSYSGDIEAAVWFGDTKQQVLIAQPVNIGAFDKAELSWTVDPSELHLAENPEAHDYEFSVIITRDGVELRIIVHVSSPPTKIG